MPSRPVIRFIFFVISVTFIEADITPPKILESHLNHKKLEPHIIFGKTPWANKIQESASNLRGTATNSPAETILSESLNSKKNLTNYNAKEIQRRVSKSVDLEIINNCDYEAYAYLIFEKENSRRSWQWQLLRRGGSFTINAVDRTAMWIYGIHAVEFSNAWKSDSSDYCFAEGDCFRTIDLNGLTGQGEHIQYSTCPKKDSFDASKAPPMKIRSPLPSSEPSTGPSIALSSSPSVVSSEAPSIKPQPRPAVETFVAFKAPPAPVESAELEFTSQQQQWLAEHNSRRRTFYRLFPERYGLDSSPLKWSDSVAASAQNYANKLIELNGCQGQHNFKGDSYGGENLAWNVGHKVRTPAEVLNAWYDNEININELQLIGMKYHASQVVFRSSLYLGCGQAEKRMNGNQRCFMQVCRYISPGNCFLSSGMSDYFPDNCIQDYPNSEWVCSALSDSASMFCAKEDELCPVEGCF